jgi:dipeptidyl aminopeptidase/acylaminoacyl peptidase
MLKRTALFTQCLLCLVVLTSVAVAQTARRPLKLDDIANFKDIRDPQLSPDGQWVAYVVSTIDAKEDKSNAQIWMTSYDGKITRQMTRGSESASSPRWSPDGKYLSFTSARPGPAKGNQVWLLDRQGGEAVQLTDVKGRLQSYEWSPDAKRLALVIGDPDPEAEEAAKAQESGGKPKAPKPIVLDRYKIKQDGQGYLRSGRHSYVYLFEVETKKLERLTSGKADETGPVWSPDGTRIAFTSNRHPDPDREPSSQIFVAEAKANAVEKAITPATSRGGGRVEWSPDGKWITFIEGDEKKFNAYNQPHLALVATDGNSAPTRIKSVEALDRGVSSPRFSADGKAILFTVTDNRSVYPARVNIANGAIEKLLNPPVVVSSWDSVGKASVVMSGGNTTYNEIYAFENGTLRQLTKHNDELFAQLDLGQTEEVGFKSKDGTDVYGLLTYPVGYVKGTKVPLLLRIHGGPNAQDQHTFSTERQLFAASGYAVLAVNYRGSSGRGQKFSRAIFADWGHYEVEDLLAGVDHVIKMGVADPERLGVGGWS